MAVHWELLAPRRIGAIFTTCGSAAYLRNICDIDVQSSGNRTFRLGSSEQARDDQS